MKILFGAPSRLSDGDAGTAVDLARRPPRNRLQVGVVAVVEVMPQRHEVGLSMPSLEWLKTDQYL